MKRVACLLVAWLLVFCALLPAADPVPKSAKARPVQVRLSLEQQVQSALSGFEGKVSLYAKNLETGQAFSRNGDARVRTASTIKLAILAAAFAAVAEGKATWEDRVTLKEEDKVSGAGILPELTAGDILTLRGLSHLMIVLSDNTATNLMLDHIPGDYVNDWADGFGLHNTRILRKVGGAAPTRAANEEPFAKYGLGVSTPHEQVTLLEKMERGEVVSLEASKEMIGILKRQQDRNGIPRHLGSLDVANKSGALDHLRSDSGIVYTKRGRIALSITCDEIPAVDWSTDNPGYVKIAKLAEILVNALQR
jgi:beta-lactamase class A